MDNNFPRIFLCGFMGSGKSTLGKALSRLLQRDFIDLDQVIEQKAGKPIPRIFAENSEDHFRALERETLAGICKKNDPFVCSLGGGSVCNEESLQLVLNSGLLVYISLPPAALADRLRLAVNERPMLRLAEHQTLEERIRELLLAREPFYQRSHITIPGISLTANAMLKSIREHQ